MPFVENGQIQKERGWLRLSIFPELFWGTLNVITVFFQTLISQEATTAYTRGQRIDGGGGGGQGGSLRRRKGFKVGTNVPVASHVYRKHEANDPGHVPQRRAQTSG